jgi:hypothetical protein
VAIISIAQQARPNIVGQSDELRAQFMTVSTLLSRMFCSTSESTPTAGSWPTSGIVSCIESILTDAHTAGNRPQSPSALVQ